MRERTFSANLIDLLPCHASTARVQGLMDERSTFVHGDPNDGGRDPCFSQRGI
jgi:hypothetical protein